MTEDMTFSSDNGNMSKNMKQILNSKIFVISAT